MFGALLACAGVGVLSGRTWAPAAYPLWSLLVLGLDAVLLYALTAAWHDVASTREDFTGSSAYDPRDRQTIWEEQP